VESTEDSVSPTGEPEAARRGRHTAAFWLRRLEFPDAPAGRDVDRADRAVIVPARERRAEVAVLETEVDVSEEQLATLLGRCELLLDQHGGRLGCGVEDVVGGRVVGRRRVVQSAERRRKDRHRLTGAKWWVLDSVDHLDALVERLARPRVEREPD